MYERFTDRARKVLQYANQEAVRRNHEFVGPEHILAGIVREGNGLACAVLKAKQVSLVAILGEVGRLVPDGPAINQVTPVPRALTPLARQVVERAMTIARELKCGYVGTEHLLLALAKEPETVAWTILTEAGITYGTVLDSIRKILGAVQPSVRQDGETAPLWIEWQHVVEAIPVMVRAIARSAEEMGPQDLAAPITLSPEIAATIFEAQLALEGKSPEHSVSHLVPVEATMDSATPDYAEILRGYLSHIRWQLNRWSAESRSGGWSTHQVEPMQRLAAEIQQVLDRDRDDVSKRGIAV